MIRSRDDLLLEAAFDRADAERAAVLCHPHPKMGGTMNAPLILALRDELVRRGFGVLRFNFRGIGSSEGESEVGLAEVADAAGALDAARDHWPRAALALVGWSFGGAVAVRTALQEPGIAAVACVAPAIAEKPEVTAGLPAAEEVRLRMPTLFVCGANDDVVPPEECRGWAEAAGVDFELIPAANHFFWGKYDSLATTIGGFLDAHVRIVKD